MVPAHAARVAPPSIAALPRSSLRQPHLPPLACVATVSVRMATFLMQHVLARRLRQPCLPLHVVVPPPRLLPPASVLRLLPSLVLVGRCCALRLVHASASVARSLAPATTAVPPLLRWAALIHTTMCASAVAQASLSLHLPVACSTCLASSSAVAATSARTKFQNGVIEVQLHANLTIACLLKHIAQSKLHNESLQIDKYMSFRDMQRFFNGHLLILPDTQEGTVPHRDRPARFPWSVGEYRCASCACAV